MIVTAWDIAERFVGLKEIPGTKKDDHQIMAMLKLDDEWPEDDEVPWCSAFVNYVAWLLRLPRSKSLRARSWLQVGVPIDHMMAQPKRGFDVVILKRGAGTQPDATNLTAPGHVGFFAGTAYMTVSLLGGNQGNAVSVATYPSDRILGVRRLWEPTRGCPDGT
jgi:uncharacterized protein (TIGR02594 family)